jgi:hypothetical protein
MSKTITLSVHNSKLEIYKDELNKLGYNNLEILNTRVADVSAIKTEISDENEYKQILEGCD